MPRYIASDFNNNPYEELWVSEPGDQEKYWDVVDPELIDKNKAAANRIVEMADGIFDLDDVFGEIAGMELVRVFKGSPEDYFVWHLRTSETDFDEMLHYSSDEKSLEDFIVYIARMFMGK